MNLFAIAVVACLLIEHGITLAQGSPSHTNDATNAVANALAEAKKTGKHVLPNFGADWCPNVGDSTKRSLIQPWPGFFKRTSSSSQFTSGGWSV